MKIIINRHYHIIPTFTIETIADERGIKNALDWLNVFIEANADNDTKELIIDIYPKIKENDQ